ncbi:hypothetical protein BY996DRAFT_6417430 [Phakopsora pachyrhizi]|nr:hypothetical protein BY996DRAFT_6417430 [Phakopsora pachyrhizi]
MPINWTSGKRLKSDLNRRYSIRRDSDLSKPITKPTSASIDDCKNLKTVTIKVSKSKVDDDSNEFLLNYKNHLNESWSLVTLSNDNDTRDKIDLLEPDDDDLIKVIERKRFKGKNYDRFKNNVNCEDDKAFEGDHRDRSSKNLLTGIDENSSKIKSKDDETTVKGLIELKRQKILELKDWVGLSYKGRLKR